MADIYECRFSDPYKKQLIVFKLVPLSNLKVTPHARKPSEAHIKRLTASIEKLGFLSPLIVVEDQKEMGKYIIIDGQHRFIAAQMMQIEKIPVFVIPQKLAQQLLTFNVEKELNIREKSYVSLSLYRDYLSTNPNTLEADPLIVDSIEHIYYVTLGLGYEKTEKLSGTIFEPVLKRSDIFLDKPLKETYSIRDDHAKKLIIANNLVSDISQRIKDLGQWNIYIPNQIVTWANPFRKRKVVVSFDELFPQFLDNLKQVQENPQKFLNEILKEEEEVF